jgi:hypothetical protein
VTFDTAIDPSIQDAVFAQFGRTGTYTRLVGDPVPGCLVIFDQEQLAQETWQEATEQRQRGQVRASQVARPARGDTWQDAATGDTWTVDGIGDFDGSVFEVFLHGPG